MAYTPAAERSRTLPIRTNVSAASVSRPRVRSRSAPLRGRQLGHFERAPYGIRDLPEPAHEGQWSDIGPHSDREPMAVGLVGRVNRAK